MGTAGQLERVDVNVIDSDVHVTSDTSLENVCAARSPARAPEDVSKCVDCEQRKVVFFFVAYPFAHLYYRVCTLI